MALTHWGRVTHICVSKLTNAGILLIGPLRTNFSEILIEILTFSFKKMRLKVSSAKRRPFCLGLNVLSGTYLWWLCVMVCLLLSQVGLLQLVICCGHLAGHVSSGIYFFAYYMPFIQRFHKIHSHFITTFGFCITLGPPYISFLPSNIRMNGVLPSQYCLWRISSDNCRQVRMSSSQGKLRKISD